METEVLLGLVAALVAGAATLVTVVWRRRRRSASAAPAVSLTRDQQPLRRSLLATRRALAGRLEAVVGRGPKPVDISLGELEEALIASDVGRTTAELLVQAIRDRAGPATEAATVLAMLRAEIRRTLETDPPPEPSNRPWVVLVLGVNGVGKTTTVGKLAGLHRAAGRRVVIVAADTFRAAAIDQLVVWADRTGADLVRHASGADPAAVVFDGMRAAIARGADVVLVDTAGRLHTRIPLVEELRKLRRVIARESPGAPHEVLLVLDATTGQNALSQAQTFKEATEVTGAIVTKLDGTARGGMALAVRRQLGIPIRYIGVGEGIDDLRVFDADEFATALLGEEAERP